MGVPGGLAAQMSVGEQHEWIREFLARRVVSRRSALRGAAGALAGLGMGALLGHAAPDVVSAAFTGRRVSYGNDPQRQMALAVELGFRPNGQVLADVGTDIGYGRTLSVDVRRLVSVVPQRDGSIRAAEQFFAHVLAEALEPGQRYHYRFRLPNGTVGPDAVFATAPAGREPFTFTAFGDQGVDVGPGVAAGFSNDYRRGDTRRAAFPARALVGLIAARNPAFHLLAGDICYADPNGRGSPVRNNAPRGPGKGFANFDPFTWTRYFASIEPSAAGTPWMFATGNHDMEALYSDITGGGASHGYGGHAARLDLPTNGPAACPSVYGFRYGNVGVLSIDANDLSTEIPTNAGYSRGAQIPWVRETLAAMRADPTVEFVVAFFHHCAFATSSAHGSDDGVRSALAPLFDEYAVDLAVQGHNHVWERTNPIRAARSTVQAPNGSTVRPATDGTTYICAGSAGRPRSRWRADETNRYPGHRGPDSGTVVESVLQVAGGADVPETVDWSQARYRGYAVLVIDVVPAAPGGESTMTVRTINDLGREIDTLVMVRTAPPLEQVESTHAAWRTTGSGLAVPSRGLSLFGTGSSAKDRGAGSCRGGGRCWGG
ncbi:MAG: metallophosphoesterase [Sporichthyaceae bacterium]